MTRKAWAFLLTVALLCQTGTGAGYAQEGRGAALRPGDHVLLGMPGPDGLRQDDAGTGYDFTVLAVLPETAESAGLPKDPEAGSVLLFYSDPLGLSQTPQQFDHPDESGDGGHPDEDSQLDGYSLWTESDLYIALNGATKAGNTELHGAAVAGARQFYEALSANETEWNALLPCTADGSDGEKVSLLSEEEFETWRGEQEDEFWYTEQEDTGFWLKTARKGYSNQVRYIYSNKIQPSLTADAYYALAGAYRSVRPALRLDRERTRFNAGSGTAEDPYRELTLLPAVEGVEMTGEPAVGERLTLTAAPAEADCVYRWYRSQGDGVSGQDGNEPAFVLIEGAEEPVYTPGPEDVSRMLLGMAAGKGEYVGTAVTAAGPVDKGRQPAPEGEEIPSGAALQVTDRRIAVAAPMEGLEYALTIGGGFADLRWTTGGGFSGLEAETDYGLYARRAERPGYYPSPAAGPVQVTTKASGTTLTLTVRVESMDPGRAAEAMLLPMTEQTDGSEERTAGATSEERTAGAASEEWTASATSEEWTASATSGGIGPTVQMITFAGIAMDQPYSLEIRKPGHLPFRQRELRLTEDTLWEIRLPCGDVNGDGSIDLKDRQLLLLASCFGKEVDTAAGEGAEQAALLDLDGDGRIGLSDLMILMLSENFGKKVPVQ